jgi:hypothetical protein
MTSLTAERLRETLHYDPETGVFTQVKRTSHRVKVGDVAGCVSDNRGYRKITVFSKKYYAHRLAWLYMTGEWAKEIDHANLNKGDNRWSNLRAATRTQNNANSPMRVNNTSGYKGVYWSKQSLKWFARIHKNGKGKHLGFFDKKEDAARVYEKACYREFGEFARPS